MKICYPIILLLFNLLISHLSSMADTEIQPRPEHPMPQMQRAEWLNLNGTWEFAETHDNADRSFLTRASYPDKIVVPFCRESKQSGLERKGFVTNVWYRRNFTVPENWQAERIRMHIGACDWITWVWINGTLIGQHVGGFSAFCFDITPALKKGENTIIIHAFDDTQSGLQPLGKQSRKAESQGIFYTRTTGIWQTVWLEGVGKSFIRDCKITPDPDHSRMILQVEIDGSSPELILQAVAVADQETVGRAETPADWRNNHLILDLSKKRLWTVDDPYLYELKLTLRKGEKTIDAVTSYFGLREVSIAGSAVLINHQPIFQRLVLDQGFYPDGIWTAPSDADLKRDIELSKSVGFNGARLHQKVFEPRFYYWADRLGYLVWGEYPSFGADYAKPEVNRPIMDEWVQILRRDRNHPSIVGWCPFNETPREAGDLQNTVVYLTRAIDPTRPVLDTSGWTHSLPDPELLDAHDYNQDPVTFGKRWENYFQSHTLPTRYGGSPYRNIPFFISEFGGIGWFERKDGKSWGYGNSPKTKEEYYERFAGLVNAQLNNRHLFGYCYTQLTDIEQERNGIFYYDRTPKFDAEKLRAIQSRPAVYEKSPPVEAKEPPVNAVVWLGGAPEGTAQNLWKYTKDQPSERWIQTDFEDAAWKEGPGGFGHKEGWEKYIGTAWNTKDIWLRRELNYEGVDFSQATLVIHYDNATQVYLNGEIVWQHKEWNDQYEGFDITAALHHTLHKGKNTIAVHCRQDEGGQFIDLAILMVPR